ncbi:MAG: glycosyltransferase [Caldilineaceae bacterium SB0661_bin_32]|uniref:Glycosyltransferase n=1 Tax=Caldilineaceae bacterium SB0661_bin_32 TaxID=2605255 RepID=A0A6B1DBW6_9CHLR|nr:glycosyltransferase [Caldilineaceae bacterium SB0661_bin_32]
MRVSVVATVYNEGNSIRTLMDSLLNQTRQPAEIVICDGGSRDDTAVILNEFSGEIPGLRILVEKGANISRGRNRAISEAAGPIIACTDAGVRLDPYWLEQLMAPFEAGTASEERSVEAVAGFFAPDVSGPFQAAMGATVLPREEEIAPERFLPSSRSIAFSKALWRRVGGYPEWLDYCEDLVFDLRIKVAEEEPAFAWAPRAVAYFRPRTDLKSFGQQYYRYARGDGKADLWRMRHAIRYATYLLLIPALLGHALWGQEARWLGWLGLIGGGLINCARPWRRLRLLARDLPPHAQMQAALFVPLIRLVGDLAKMAGYPVGLIWRRRNLHRSEIHWRDV